MLYRNLIMPKIKVATGLYSHWDSIIRIDKEILKWIKNSEGVRPNNIVLNSLEEVIYTLKESIKNGNSESLITKKVYNELNSLFQKRELRIGGNGNYMGRVLLELGMKPLVSYPTRPEKLMMSSPEFGVAVKNKIKLPKDAIRKNDPEYDHIIFESDKWRNIMSWDLMSSQGIFDEEFLKIAFEPKLTDVVIIGYAHLLLPKYKKRTDEIIGLIHKKRPKIHLEMGLGSEISMKYALEKFAEYGVCDSLGLDERECKVYFKSKSENKEDLTEASLNAIKDYNLKRICVHSPTFAFSISKYDLKKELDALRIGCLVASLKISDKAGNQNGKILKEKIGNYNFCLVPSFFVKNPKRITGVGDAFAAVQAVKILS